MIAFGDVIALMTALGVGAVIQALINAWLNRRRGKVETAKVEADTTETLGRIWKGLLDELQEKLQKQDERIKVLEAGEVMKNNQIKKMEDDLAKKDRQIAYLEEEINELRNFIQELGYTPPPRKSTKRMLADV